MGYVVLFVIGVLIAAYFSKKGKSSGLWKWFGLGAALGLLSELFERDNKPEQPQQQPFDHTMNGDGGGEGQ